ncbi:hypothetical protein KGM_203102 [Danaus plexippus plexippus]|uniref:Uncharacterized protein n=1 Tax=Danaus plexippus plexippus TaxID=278856 RepID=A0A212F3T9_DANPL|nr:hypothetical protein KGM_203102 [Danaus plexippus plexippus]
MAVAHAQPLGSVRV